MAALTRVLLACYAMMLLRPAVGGWVDRFAARRVILPGIALLAFASLVLHVPATPEAVIIVMVGTGLGQGLVSCSRSRSPCPRRWPRPPVLYLTLAALVVDREGQRGLALGTLSA